MVLTAKQRTDLHVAIADYLRSNGFDAASRAVADETGVEPGASGSDALEKKWTAVVRLQKRTMELEAQVKQLEDELKNSHSQPSASRRTKAEVPERNVLKVNIEGRHVYLVGTMHCRALLFNSMLFRPVQVCIQGWSVARVLTRDVFFFLLLQTTLFP